MQRYAHAAFRDGLDLETIRTLASLASWGRHESNAERDFHRAIPHLYNNKFWMHHVSIERFDRDLGRIVQTKTPVLLASTVIHELWKIGDANLWDACFGATATKTHDFWTTLHRDNPSWDHPLFESPGSNIDKRFFSVPKCTL